MSSDMHIDHTGGFPQEMIVNRCLLDAILLKLQHDGFNFIFRQNEVSITIASLSIFLKASHEPRRYRHAIFYHLHVPAGGGRTWRRPPVAFVQIDQVLYPHVSTPRPQYPGPEQKQSC